MQHPRRFPTLSLPCPSLARGFYERINIGSIIVDVTGRTELDLDDYSVFSETESQVPADGQLPDIYYIILDGYGRADVLQQTHEFDNTEFLDSLSQRGFFVASESRANYPSTRFSLASSLNMAYLKQDDPSPHYLDTLIENNNVVRFLKSIGYKIVHMDSGHKFTARNSNADIRLTATGSITDDPVGALFFNDFFAFLTRSTAARAVPRIRSFLLAGGAKVFTYNMGKLRDIPEMPESTFTFNHNLPPHPPYVFNRDGGTPPPSIYGLAGTPWKRTDLYIDQLVYVNNRIGETVDEILARSPREPIIMIQGDHGPLSTTTPDNSFNQLSFFERTGILNAYYLPEHCRDSLYPTITS